MKFVPESFRRHLFLHYKSFIFRFQQTLVRANVSLLVRPLAGPSGASTNPQCGAAYLLYL
jgi:hypothetical protein